MPGKQKLWPGLLNFKLNNEPGEWCLGGDFNSITKVGERKGCNSVGGKSERAEFAEFINAFEVVDIPLVDKKFSWFNSDGSAISRLDRFFLSEGFIEKGSISNQWVGGRNISDHCPIWLSCSNLNWGPKPFKFNNYWLQHPDFFAFVKQTWENLDIRGKKTFVLKEKLRKLKEILKVWNREVFGILDLNIDKTVKELNEVEELIANGHNDPITSNPRELITKFWEQMHYKENLINQKSRTKWIQEGDSNTCFFHASIKGRRRRNQLLFLNKGNSLIQGVAEIKEEVKDNFSRHFTEEWSSRPFLQGIAFDTLSADDNALLLEPFDEEEVKETIWSCHVNKSPGPDGFNLNFFKTCWPIVKNDVMAFVSEFHDSACLPKVVTASFLTLIPKKD
ncbi:cysteine-rich receptor-like protein kinase, partial [Trifolium pratense]